MKRACVKADEYDAFTGWRRVLYWQRGELRKIKRRSSKRDRRYARVIIEADAPPVAFFDEYDLAVIGMYEELEDKTGECRHSCNGGEVIHGYASDVCDFTCHPGLTARASDENAAAD